MLNAQTTATSSAAMEQRMVLNEMETSSCSSSSYGDEDSGFIDMEVTSATSPRFRYSAPIQSREFEFQMSNVTHEKDSTKCCPADELFYKGKLLPLHIPPRLQMFEKLIQHNTTATNTAVDASKAGLKLDGDSQQLQFRNPLFGSATAPCTNSNTPLDISPFESCRASTELNPDEYFFDWSTEITSLIARDTHACHHHHHLQPKNSWSRKIKHSLLGKKLKASRSYLKSLFNKSVCYNEACGKSTCNADKDQLGEGGCVLKAKECVNKYIKVTNMKKPFGSLQHENFNIASLLIKNRKETADDGGQTRKSFSGAINWSNAPTTTKCSSTSNSSGSSSSSSSSSFSFNLNGFYDLKLLKQSSSANSDLDRSVDGAIAYCKQSQKMQCS